MQTYMTTRIIDYAHMHAATTADCM